MSSSFGSDSTLRTCAQVVAVVIVAAAFCAVFFWPGTFGGRSLASGDALLQGVSIVAAPAVLWDPGFTLGHPLYADPNEAFFYPPAIVARLARVPFNLYMIAPFAIALCGVFGLARRYTSSVPAGIVSALSFALGGFMISHAGHVNIDHPVAWSVVFLFAVEEIRLRPHGQWPVVAGAIALALCAVSGQPQVLAFVLAIALFYVAWFARSAPAGATGFVVRTGVALAAGLGLGAVLLLPEMQLASLGFRSHLTIDQMVILSMPLPELPVRLVFPHVLDADSRDRFTELSNSSGSIALLLAIAAAVASWKDMRVRFWAMVALAGFALSTGSALGLAQITSHIPVYDLFRIPGRHAYEIDLAVALLAGFGTADIIAKRLCAKATIVAVGTVAFVVALALIELSFGQTPPFRFVRNLGPQLLDVRENSVLLVPLLFTTLGMLLLAAGRFLPVRMLAPLIVVAVLGDVSAFAWHSYWNTASTSLDALQPTPIALAMQRRLEPEKRFVWLPGVLDPAGIAPDLMRVWGVPEAQGYTSLDVASAARFLEMTPSAGIFEGLSDGALDLASVQYVGALRTIAHAVSATAPIAAAGLSQYIGSPASGAASAVDHLGLPAPVRADELALVTTLGNSVAIPQGAVVARLSIRLANGRTIEKPLRAGIESSEFAYDRPDVRALVKHARAPIFPSSDGGHQYLALVPFGATLSVRAITITWIWDPRDRAAMTINGASFIDHRSGSAFPFPNGLQASLFADWEHWKYEPFGDYDLFSNTGAMPQDWIAQRLIVMPDEAALAALHDERPATPKFSYRTDALSRAPLALGTYAAGDVVSLRAATATSRELFVSCASACLVVDAGTSYPGWVASIDGRETPVETIDFALRGVLVPAGQHRVALVFRPAVLGIGIVLSLTSLVALLLYVVVMRRAVLRRALTRA